jgi:hypothetical protein
MVTYRHTEAAAPDSPPPFPAMRIDVFRSIPAFYGKMLEVADSAHRRPPGG